MNFVLTMSPLWGYGIIYLNIFYNHVSPSGFGGCDAVASTFYNHAIPSGLKEWENRGVDVCYIHATPSGLYGCLDEVMSFYNHVSPSGFLPHEYALNFSFQYSLFIINNIYWLEIIFYLITIIFLV